MPEIQDVFRLFGPEYREKYSLPLHHLKTMSAIEQCRTASLGGHMNTCDECGHTHISYNSCKNRHCPKCQSLSKEKWLNQQEQSLLLTHYFHVVFTLPEELRPIVLRNQNKMYSLLFTCVSETLLELSRDSGHLGAEIGFTTILHTWGQNLMYHPHIHCIIPGGGLSFFKNRWISTKKKYFIPVKVLGKKFRGKFLFYLKKLFHSNGLQFVGEIETLAQPKEFQNLLDTLFEKSWNVYAKPKFKNSHQVLKYLGRYTHRVAISNERIVKIENNQVTFQWKDYKDQNKTKMMTLDALEFIRRFLLHVLPFKFVKIRHYGFLSNRNKRASIPVCKKCIEIMFKVKHPEIKILSTEELILKISGIDIHICPSCKKGKLHREQLLRSALLAPT